MKTGDKIRFVHSKGGGVIRRIVDEKTLEVEIEDGFIIPVKKSEVVVVAIAESETFKKKEQVINLPVNYQTEGLHLAFTPFNDRVYSIHLINNTDIELLYTYNQEKDGIVKGVISGILKRKSQTKIGEAIVAEFENWPLYIFQFLLFKEGEAQLKPPMFKKMNFKASVFFKSKKIAPVLNKDAFMFQLDKEIDKINAEELQSKMEDRQPEKAEFVMTRPSNEVDLHIEKIEKNYQSIDKGEILKIQLKHFERSLDNALASGMEEIVFIHGVGNGTLKNEIHKILSQNKLIAYFKDARKEKFGYGATLVRIKE